jgi:hypothetical protein
MLSDLWPKHWKARALCGCLAASIAAPYLASVWNRDPQAKLPRINVMGQGLTGSNGDGNDQLARRYDRQRCNNPGPTVCLGLAGSPRKAVVGPTGAGGDSRRLNTASVTGTTGLSGANSGGEFSKGPTGAATAKS